MAVRHEVENLIRPRKHLYWRARLPLVFGHCRPGRPLAGSTAVPAPRRGFWGCGWVIVFVDNAGCR